MFYLPRLFGEEIKATMLLLIGRLKDGREKIEERREFSGGS
jgi:hypothetical protein